MKDTIVKKLLMDAGMKEFEKATAYALISGQPGFVKIEWNPETETFDVKSLSPKEAPK